MQYVYTLNQAVEVVERHRTFTRFKAARCLASVGGNVAVSLAEEQHNTWHIMPHSTIRPCPPSDLPDGAHFPAKSAVDVLDASGEAQDGSCWETAVFLQYQTDGRTEQPLSHRSAAACTVLLTGSLEIVSKPTYCIRSGFDYNYGAQQPEQLWNRRQLPLHEPPAQAADRLLKNKLEKDKFEFHNVHKKCDAAGGKWFYPWTPRGLHAIKYYSHAVQAAVAADRLHCLIFKENVKNLNFGQDVVAQVLPWLQAGGVRMATCDNLDVTQLQVTQQPEAVPNMALLPAQAMGLIAATAGSSCWRYTSQQMLQLKMPLDSSQQPWQLQLQVVKVLSCGSNGEAYVVLPVGGVHKHATAAASSAGDLAAEAAAAAGPLMALLSGPAPRPACLKVCRPSASLPASSIERNHTARMTACLAAEHGHMQRFAACAQVLSSYAFGLAFAKNCSAATSRVVPAVLMELADKGTLQDLLQASSTSPIVPLNSEEAWWAVQQVAEALQYIHTRGFIFVDLKPSNVGVVSCLDQHFPPRLGTCKLLDFGSCRQVSASGFTDLQLAPGDVIAGATVAYMSPEHWQGQQISAAVDVWALACLLLHLRLGQAVRVLPAGYQGSGPWQDHWAAVLASLRASAALNDLELQFLSSCLVPLQQRPSLQQLHAPGCYLCCRPSALQDRVAQQLRQDAMANLAGMRGLANFEYAA